MTSDAPTIDDRTGEPNSKDRRADSPRPSDGSPWWKARLAAVVDTDIEWRRRALTAIGGRVTARLEVALPSLEVELARQALLKEGWQALSVEESAGDSGQRRALMLGTKRLPSTLIGSNTARVARRVKVFLAEARVWGVESIAVTTARPDLEGVEGWVPAQGESPHRTHRAGARTNGPDGTDSPSAVLGTRRPRAERGNACRPEQTARS